MFCNYQVLYFYHLLPNLVVQSLVRKKTYEVRLIISCSRKDLLSVINNFFLLDTTPNITTELEDEAAEELQEKILHDLNKVKEIPFQYG